MKVKIITSINILIVALFSLLVVAPVTMMAQYADHRGRHIDSIETALASPTPPQGDDLLRAYRDLAWGYLQIDGKKSEKSARQLLALTYPAKAMLLRVDALRILGLQAYSKNDYDTALTYYNQALAVTDSMRLERRYSEDDIDDNLSSLYGTIGNLYNIQDQLLLAIEYYQKALPIFEKHNWRESQTILYHNIGEMYLSMGNNEEAKHNYQLAIEKGTDTGDSLMMALPTRGLMKVHIEEKNYQKALESANFCYTYYYPHRKEELNDYLQVLAGMARINLMEGHVDLQQAEATIHEALKLLKEDTNAETLSDVYSAAAEVAMAKHDWQQAADYTLKAIEANPNETYNDMGNYALLAEIYAHTGQQNKAAEYIHKLHQGMERFSTEHYQSGLSQMEVHYQTLQKEAEIAQLRKDKRWLTWSTVLTSLAIVLLIALLFIYYQWNKLRRQHREILVSMEVEAKERERIGRDLHDRMGALLTGIKLNLEVLSLNNKDTIAKENALKLTDEAVKEMRNVAHHLMPDSLKRYGLQTALNNFCQSVPTVSFTFVGKEHRLPQNKEEAIYYIVHELVNNAAKNAQASDIYVQLIMNEGYTAVNVSDNGKGLPEQTQSLRFGMQSIEQRVKAIDGQLD
ncbi:MAG: tetratricopeptide repeat protein, partial [Bacteroidaceae bacterium]|nr:tetratricopeptide repeat protein [Bacteroidaceae bacterium]